uniref:Protein kinase domain-containing protein n=1 Tax=Macrostomum lignano TaxID=282301 RepID=A0A1I8F108_9PLAT
AATCQLAHKRHLRHLVPVVTCLFAAARPLPAPFVAQLAAKCDLSEHGTATVSPTSLPRRRLAVGRHRLRRWRKFLSAGTRLTYLAGKFGRIGTVTTVREMCPQSGPRLWSPSASSGHARCGRLNVRDRQPDSPPERRQPQGCTISSSLISMARRHLGHATGQARLARLCTRLLAHAANGAVCRAVCCNDYGPLVRDRRSCRRCRLRTAADARPSLPLRKHRRPAGSKSVLAASARACLAAGGKVNSRGNCHCPRGLGADPTVWRRGAGGSVDSGPATVDSSSGRDGATGSGSQGAGAIAGISDCDPAAAGRSRPSPSPCWPERNGRVKSRLGDLPCLPACRLLNGASIDQALSAAASSAASQMPCIRLPSNSTIISPQNPNSSGIQRPNDQAAPSFISSTYTDGRKQLTDRSACGRPQVRQPKRTNSGRPATDSCRSSRQ